MFPLIKIKWEIQRGRSFLSFFALRVFGDGFSYILPLILARYLSPPDFGVFSLARMVVFLVVTATVSSSATPFIVSANKEASEGGRGIARSFTNQLLFLSVSLAVGTATIICFQKPLSSFIGIDTEHYPYLLFLLFSVSANCFIVNTFLALNKKRTAALFSMVVGITNIAIFAVFCNMLNLQLHHIFISFFLASAVGCALFCRYLPRKQLFPLILDKISFIIMCKWTGWQVFGLLSVQLINWGGNIVLRYYASFEEIGVYNVAYQVFKGLTAAMLIINMYFLPFVSRYADNPKKISTYLNEKRIKIFLAGTSAVAVLALCSPLIFRLLYGNVYAESVPIFQILLIGSLFYLYTVFYVPLFNAWHRYKFIQINNVVMVALNITLNFVLVPHLGIKGPAVVTTMVYAMSAISFELYFRNVLKNRQLHAPQ